MKCERYVIGLGQYLRSDDGVGLRVIDTLIERGLDNGFKAVSLGGDGLSALAYFTEKIERIVFVDCALMDLAPGEYRVFSPDKAVSRKALGRVSTHESDILKLIELARQVCETIPDIRILAIQPQSLEAGTCLSKPLSDMLETYVQTALAEINRPGRFPWKPT